MALVAFEYQPTQDGLKQAAADLKESNDFVLRRFAVTELSRRADSASPFAGVLGTALVSDEDPGVRHWAAVALAGLDCESAATQVDCLGRALEDKDPGTRCWATIALGHTGNAAQPYANALRKRLLDSDPDARVEAARALMAADPSEAEEVAKLLAPKLEDKEVMFRVAALKQFSVLGEAAMHFLPVIRLTLEDPHATVRKSAADALKTLGDAAVKACIARLSKMSTSDIDEAVRQSASAAMAVCDVGESLHAEDAAIRLWATTSLTSMPEMASERATVLVELLGDNSSDVRLAAVNALRNADMVKEYAFELSKCLEDTEAEVRLAASKSLINTDNAIVGQIAAAAAEHFKDESQKSRAAAFECLALTEIGALPYLQEVVAAMQDTCPAVRLHAISCMMSVGKMAVFQHAALLAQIVKTDKDLAVRRIARQPLEQYQLLQRFDL